MMVVSWVSARDDCILDVVIISLSSAVGVCSEDGEFPRRGSVPCHYMTEVSPMRLRCVCARRSCGHSRCPNRIGGSYVEQLGTTRSQVISIDAWSRMGTDAQFHALDRGRETVDGRTVPIRTRSLNVHATIHLVSMCHGPLLDGTHGDGLS
ncbi:UNVERIFIED_CONTAM: hypothetical protein Slati_3924900 [Sesamum latifolium]|uniref:Uncharacterized protein n=1 Tax=Sesamum latifolium TaxID=2727402 RepID=A0AAW2TNX5_9LAMI